MSTQRSRDSQIVPPPAADGRLESGLVGASVEWLIELLIRLCGWSAILFVAAIFFFVLREAHRCCSAS